MAIKASAAAQNHGLRPYPASGIRLGFSGNTANADGIRLGQSIGSG